ncbi:hypothetical protein MS3_00006304 [Schistosoma haematobium]|uniref:Reverse transcriptase domain-containing protein n=3 Tax=Schistosoma TaxID=6181 RepID=A0A922IQP7_SCHHA|nr:hypothetical protein MS3_00006304 [Schistosoma haematobium]KAH9584848.1 hypothetical protein MS3_00006304 [Schistosoma haematobium]
MDPVVIEKGTVLRLLQHLKPDKSSGPDDIHLRIMKALSDVIAEPLTNLFDMSLGQSRLPRNWKDAIIGLVYKAGSRGLVSNYRPVSLTSAVVKPMEKIIRISVINYVEGHNLFSREQHGFRRGLSCLTNLITREDRAAEKDKNIPVDVMFIDLSNAFDKVSHSGLKSKLERFGIHYTVVGWISNFLHDRRQRVRVNGPTPRGYLNHMEIARSISSIIKRTVDPNMLFDKGEYMDEVLWQLLCTVYDIPSSNFTKVYFLKLFMMTATNLGYAGNFTLSNFSRDKRDRRKWIHFLSCLVSWFECADTEILEMVDEARERKSNYAKLLSLVESREHELHTLRDAESKRRNIVKDLEKEVYDIKHRFNEKNKKMPSAENLLLSLVSSTEQKKEQIESSRERLQTLLEEYENTRSHQLENCEMLPESISRVKCQLDSIESDMHRLFEAFNHIVDRNITFQSYECLLESELKPAMDQGYVVMDKLESCEKQEKSTQGKIDVLTTDLKNMDISLNEAKQHLVEYRSQLVRKKVLLNTKKKTREADIANKTKENDSFISERQHLRTRLSEIAQENSSIVEQINLEEQRLQTISKNHVHVEELNKALLEISQMVTKTPFPT